MSIDLAFDQLDGARASRTIAFLHGILGRGNNLRSIARRFIEERPEWTAWLVDLRGHGRSPKGTPGPSVEAAAGDVVKLARRASQAGLPFAAIAGHSFGGKIALEAARIGSLESISSLDHVVVIDSVPGIREPVRGNDSALGVIETLESLPQTFPSKAAFVEALVERGKTRELAQWLAQSVEKDSDGDRVRFMLDLDEIRALILDYFSRDLWPVVEHPPGSTRAHLVIADRSDSYTPASRERAARIAASTARVTVDILPAGHWVHVDDPEGLLRTLLNRVSD
jgi:esterase